MHSALNPVLGPNPNPLPFGSLNCVLTVLLLRASAAMLTRDIGSKGASDCLAPPGWAQAAAGANITECPVNTYKEGWNRNNCTSCGTNVVTAETGTVSKEGCLVPPGYGLTSLSPVMVASP
jgi:hypothetical protein